MMTTHTIDDLTRAINSITAIAEEMGILNDAGNKLKVNC